MATITKFKLSSKETHHMTDESCNLMFGHNVDAFEKYINRNLGFFSIGNTAEQAKAQLAMSMLSDTQEMLERDYPKEDIRKLINCAKFMLHCELVGETKVYEETK